MTVHYVLVESSTHDEMKLGLLCTERTWVQVLAENEVEAMQVAAQMALCRGRYVTLTTPEV